jgi:hypothetical protein
MITDSGKMQDARRVTPDKRLPEPIMNKLEVPGIID